MIISRQQSDAMIKAVAQLTGIPERILQPPDLALEWGSDGGLIRIDLEIPVSAADVRMIMDSMIIGAQPELSAGDRNPV